MPVRNSKPQHLGSPDCRVLDLTKVGIPDVPVLSFIRYTRRQAAAGPLRIAQDLVFRSSQHFGSLARQASHRHVPARLAQAETGPAGTNQHPRDARGQNAMSL